MTLDELILRLEKARARDRELDYALWLTAGQPGLGNGNFTGSLDAIVALIESVLPTWKWRAGRLGDYQWAEMSPPGGLIVDAIGSQSANVAIALCLAFAQALRAVRKKESIA